jgi:alkylated DNA repair dioxygenase AlkB
LRYISYATAFGERIKFSPIMTQLNLEISLESEALPIPGLKYIPHYIDIDEQNQLIDIIDQQVWSLESIELKRRIQQHGYRYDYRNGFLVESRYLGPLPDWSGRIANRIYSDGLVPTVPDQVTVNEYEPGQGLTSHVDCVTCFGQAIITLSLGSSYVMEFTHPQTEEKKEILLLPGSLLVLQADARYVWEHSVTPRNKDIYNGKEFVRTRRVAMTFREALFPYK